MARSRPRSSREDQRAERLVGWLGVPGGTVRQPDGGHMAPIADNKVHVEQAKLAVELWLWVHRLIHTVHNESPPIG